MASAEHGLDALRFALDRGPATALLVHLPRLVESTWPGAADVAHEAVRHACVERGPTCALTQIEVLVVLPRTSKEEVRALLRAIRRELGPCAVPRFAEADGAQGDAAEDVLEAAYRELRAHEAA